MWNGCEFAQIAEHHRKFNTHQCAFGWAVAPTDLYAEILPLGTSECELIWKQSHRIYNQLNEKAAILKKGESKSSICEVFLQKGEIWTQKQTGRTPHEDGSRHGVIFLQAKGCLRLPTDRLRVGREAEQGLPHSSQKESALMTHPQTSGL